MLSLPNIAPRDVSLALLPLGSFTAAQSSTSGSRTRYGISHLTVPMTLLLPRSQHCIYTMHPPQAVTTLRQMDAVNPTFTGLL